MNQNKEDSTNETPMMKAEKEWCYSCEYVRKINEQSPGLKAVCIQHSGAQKDA